MQATQQRMILRLKTQLRTKTPLSAKPDRYEAVAALRRFKTRRVFAIVAAQEAMSEGDLNSSLGGEVAPAAEARKLVKHIGVDG
ncbi:MAG: hypothetical protein NW215_01920 [Hyphomicrobiales bacterium]|nr:hypothetical protein [Hyphomicrobiales bacterium]